MQFVSVEHTKHWECIQIIMTRVNIWVLMMPWALYFICIVSTNHYNNHMRSLISIFIFQVKKLRHITTKQIFSKRGLLKTNKIKWKPVHLCSLHLTCKLLIISSTCECWATPQVIFSRLMARSWAEHTLIIPKFLSEIQTFSSTPDANI